jgi:c(7)-type cytochrome triheme protein
MKHCLNLLLTASLVMCSGISAVALEVRDVTFVTKGAGKVVFTHTSHLKHKGTANNCNACHDGIFSIKKKIRFTMADMERGKSCGACHNGTKAFPLKECARCHRVKDVVFQVKATGPTLFSHAKHLDANPDCTACHPKLFVAGHNKRVTMADMKKGKSCGACHDGTKAFSIDQCTSCHPVKEITFRVKETGPTPFSHAKHLEAYRCSDCHTRLYPVTRHGRHVGMSEMGKGKSCGACHDGKVAFPLKNCTACHPVHDVRYEVKGLSDVTFSHAMHTGIYTCKDCHTSLFATSRSRGVVSMKEMERGKSCGACHDGKTAFSVAGKCDSCHK